MDGTNAAQGTIAASAGILSSALPASIGARQSGIATAYDNQFVGSIEEVAIYGYALSTNQVQAHFLTAQNRAPTFTVNPFAAPSVIAGQSYSGTLASAASDPNGDTITFAKVSGPAWLNVASNGALSGSPLSANVGVNGFVVSATDPGGLTGTATMNLTVLGAAPIVASGGLQGGNLLLSWAGGIAPYQVQVATNPSAPVWLSLGPPVSNNSLLVPRSNPAAFYRISGQ